MRDSHDWELRLPAAQHRQASAKIRCAATPLAMVPEKHMDSHEKDRLYLKGLEAFNSAQFYEAHEHWEEVWLETPHPDKMFLQGLIQVAAAFHHYFRANLQGTRNLLYAGLVKLDRFPEVHRGLEIAPLREAVREWLAAIDAQEILDGRERPRITRLGDWSGS
jgi:predicted metal-dependent hydrolase